MSKTTVNIGPPPGSTPVKEKAIRRRLQMTVPAPKSIGDNLSRPTDDFVDMNFKVSEAFHRRFKVEATLRGISMKELLETSFKAYLDKHGAATDSDLFPRG